MYDRLHNIHLKLIFFKCANLVCFLYKYLSTKVLWHKRQSQFWSFWCMLSWCFLSPPFLMKVFWQRKQIFSSSEIVSFFCSLLVFESSTLFKLPFMDELSLFLHVLNIFNLDVVVVLSLKNLKIPRCCLIWRVVDCRWLE